MAAPTLASIEAKLYKYNEYGVKYQDPEAKLTPEEIKFLGTQFNLNKDVHRTCINCQTRQYLKYKNHPDVKDGARDFKVPCKFISASLPPGSATIIDKMVAEKGLEKKRAELVLKATQDPVAWLELMFGFDDKTMNTENEWYLRPYQKEQLRCSSRRLVLRQGRRTGKTFAMALKLIYLAYNMRIPRGTANGETVFSGPQIMVVTPYQAQVSNIFSEIEKILLRNKDLSAEIVTGNSGSLYVKTPFLRMEFSNGAVISGFVSGVGEKADGSGGGTIRGQSADIVYIDEMDMVPNKILVEAILPILASRKGTMLFASTTPIGKRGQFYNWCKNDPTFKEDHLPSTVLPQWEENKDLLIGDSNKEAILSEYMAEFIEGSFGVFRPSWVYGSAYEYEYEKTIMGNYLREKLKVLRPENMLKCIGIDWNKNAGTEFCVVGFDPDSGRWIVLETVNIAASEFSSIKWKEEVIRLNYKWKPNYIYADEGYGHTIIEDLKILSHKVRQSDKPTPQHVETAKIVDRLVSFNFSSRVELRNPIDSTVIVKTGKEFLVENTIRIFEDSNIIFSNEDTTLRLQLLNYVVKRRNPQNNKPIYGPDNEKIADHRLDAFMLALGGLYLQESEYAMDNGLSTKPGLLSRELLEKRADKKQVSFVPEIFGQLKENSPIVGNTTLSFLEIVRQGGAGSPSATPEKQPRVTRRSEGMASDYEESVYEHFKSLGSTKGYGTDEEHLNQKHGGPSIIPGRRGPQSGRPKFNRGR